MTIGKNGFRLLLLGCCLTATPAGGEEKVGLVVQHAWTPPSATVLTDAPIYMTITNRSEAADRLISATTSIAERVAFHASARENGIAHMRELDMVEVPAQAPALLKPGRTHLMLIGVKKRLKLYERYSLRLVFAQFGAVDVSVTIKRIPVWEHDDANPPRHHGSRSGAPTRQLTTDGPLRETVRNLGPNSFIGPATRTWSQSS